MKQIFNWLYAANFGEENPEPAELKLFGNKKYSFKEFNNSYMIGTWEGEYVGHHSNSEIEETISRHYKLIISECTEDGHFGGTGIVTSSINDSSEDKVQYASYYLEGEVDFETGIISFQGTEMIQYPDIGNANFTMIPFYGTVDVGNDIITGIVDIDNSRLFFLEKSGK